MTAVDGSGAALAAPRCSATIDWSFRVGAGGAYKSDFTDENESARELEFYLTSDALRLILYWTQESHS